MHTETQRFEYPSELCCPAEGTGVAHPLLPGRMLIVKSDSINTDRVQKHKTKAIR